MAETKQKGFIIGGSTTPMEELHHQIRERYGYAPMFAARDSVQEALDYCKKIIDGIDPSHRIHVTTGVQVLLNTYANKLADQEIKLIQEILPEKVFEKMLESFAPVNDGPDIPNIDD